MRNRNRNRGRLRARRGLIFLPYGTKRRTERVPYVTYALIAVNVLVWLVCLADLKQYHTQIIPRFGMVPATFHWDALFTSLFLHDAPLPLHLAGNMFFLWLFGRHVEDALGHPLYVFAYFAGGVAAHVLNVLVATQLAPQALGIPTIGASGAIAGIMGIYAVRFYQTKVVALLGVGLPPILGFARQVLMPSVVAVGIWVGWELLQGLMDLQTAGESGGVAYWAHIGGAAFGALTALAMGLGHEAADVYSEDNAYALFREGEWRTAIPHFEEVVRDNPAHADAHVKLAICYDLINRPPRAEREYLQALQLYEQQGDRDMALDTFTRLLRVHHTSSLPAGEYRRLAGLLEAAADQATAAYAYEVLAKVHPTSPEATGALLRAGELYLGSLRQPSQALRVLQVLVARQPSAEVVAQAQEGIARAQAMLPQAPARPA